LPPNTTVFLRGLWLCEKKEQILARVSDPKEKVGVIAHFSEIIDLRFGKKMAYILCILTLFLNYGCLVMPEKKAGLPTFFSFRRLKIGSGIHEKEQRLKF